MKESIYNYDPAVALENEESIAVFLALSRETGLSGEQLYRSFSEQGNPTLKNMFAVMRALGLDMTVKPHKPAV